MMSLRLCALFILALAGLALAKERASRKPYMVGIYNNLAMSCSGAVVSPNTILVDNYCITTSSPIHVNIRYQDTPVYDSGDIYRISRMLLEPEDPMDPVGSMYRKALIRLDRDIDGGEGHQAPNVPKGNVVIPEGTVCSTVRRSYTSSNYWAELYIHNVQVVSEAKCKEAFPDTWHSDLLCVGAIDPNGEMPNNECQGEMGAPLVCGDDLVAINSCEISCYGELCSYRRLSSFGDFIRELEEL